MDTNSVMELVGIIVLLLLSGFFSSAETALTTVNTIRMKALADEGNKQAKAILHVKNNSSKTIKDYEVAVLAYDKNNYPLKIKPKYNYSGGGFEFTGKADNVNVVAGATRGKDYG